MALISQEHHHNFESAASSASSSYLPEPPRTFERKQAELKSILKKRPEKAELQNMHILKYGSDISIIESQEREKKNQIESKLASHLLQRPDVTSLKQSKILFFSDEIEVAATYKKTEYNRRPEEDSTFKRLTPQLKNQIREELNTFKKNEMVVHEDSTFFSRVLDCTE